MINSVLSYFGYQKLQSVKITDEEIEQKVSIATQDAEWSPTPLDQKVSKIFQELDWSQTKTCWDYFTGRLDRRKTQVIRAIQKVEVRSATATLLAEEISAGTFQFPTGRTTKAKFENLILGYSLLIAKKLAENGAPVSQQYERNVVQDAVQNVLREMCKSEKPLPFVFFKDQESCDEIVTTLNDRLKAFRNKTAESDPAKGRITAFAFSDATSLSLGLPTATTKPQTYEQCTEKLDAWFTTTPMLKVLPKEEKEAIRNLILHPILWSGLQYELQGKQLHRTVNRGVPGMQTALIPHGTRDPMVHIYPKWDNEKLLVQVALTTPTLAQFNGQSSPYGVGQIVATFSFGESDAMANQFQVQSLKIDSVGFQEVTELKEAPAITF